MILAGAMAIVTMMASNQNEPTRRGKFLSFPADRAHGYQMNCGIFISQFKGVGSRSALRTIPSESTIGPKSASAISGWHQDLIKRYGQPTMVLRSEQCRDNIRLVVYATRPESLTNLGAMSPSCPARACLRVIADHAYCGDPKRRGIGKVAYHLLYLADGELRSKTTVVNYDRINRSYFSKPAFRKNPYQMCPLPSE